MLKRLTRHFSQSSPGSSEISEHEIAIPPGGVYIFDTIETGELTSKEGIGYIWDPVWWKGCVEAIAEVQTAQIEEEPFAASERERIVVEILGEIASAPVTPAPEFIPLD